MATNKYSVRGEADMKQHDSAIKKSASEVYKYKKQVEGTKADIKKFAGGVSDLVGKFGKFVPAIAAVSSATAIFNKLMDNSNSLADTYGKSMQVAKSGVDSFFQGIMDFVKSGEFTTFNEFLKNGGKYAKQFYDSADAWNTQKTWNVGIYADLEAKMAKQRAIIDDITKSEKERVAAQKELNRLTKEFENTALTSQKKAQNELYNKIRNIAQYDFDDKAMQWILKGLYTGSLQDTINELRKKQDIYTNVPSKQNIPEARRMKLMADGLQRLMNVASDDKGLQDLINSWAEASNAVKYYYDVLRRNNKSNNKNITSTSKSKEREEIEVPPKIFSEEADLIAGMYTTISEANKEILDKQLNTLPALEGHIEVNKELAMLYAKENDLLEEQHELLNLQIDSISSLGSVFSNLGDTFDNTELKAAGIITQAIATLIEGYTKAMASWAATTSPWAWIGFSVAGLATLTSVISQIHSLSGYASGGIIQGANTIGDYNLARVNSGEMILNGTQQARLFSLLNSPITGNNVSASNQVEFKIKGQDLVGIITNYNKKVGRVL